jgi:hypothetical protein
VQMGLCTLLSGRFTRLFPVFYRYIASYVRTNLLFLGTSDNYSRLVEYLYQ